MNGQSERGALDGIRVLDFTHVLAGPFCTRILADMGADVVKIMSDTRPGLAGGVDSPYHTMWNRTKRVLQLNLAREDARAIGRRLALKADVVIDNFSVGVLDRWGLGYDDVAPDNPGAIYVGMSGMGITGPWANYVTYAPTVHALAGLTYLTGVPGRNDIGIGFSYNDHLSGLHGAVAVLAALEARRTTGRGQRVDLSQFEVGTSFSGPALLDWFAHGRAAEPVGNDPPWDQIAPHAIYPCAGDDRWLAIAVETDTQWRALCEVLDASDWSSDASLATAEGRWARRDELDQRIAAWTSQRDDYEAMSALQAAGRPRRRRPDRSGLGGTRSAARTQRDVSWISRIRIPSWARSRRIACRFASTAPPQPSTAAPTCFGESNASVLSDWLSMETAQVAELESNGVVE